MTVPNTSRRGFLKLLGVGAAAALAEEPVRKMWFVPSNAPVGSRVERPMRLVNTVTGESVGFGSVDVQFGDQPPIYFDLAEANREWNGFNLSREPLVIPDDLASIVAEEVPAGRPFNFPVHLLDYSRYDFECSPYDVLVAQPGHEPTLLPHGTKVEYLTMNSDEWFYRDLADKAGPEIRVIIAHPLPGPPPGPVYWSKINDPADVQVDPELHRQLHIEAAKRYRAEHGRNYWDPPAFGDGLAAYHQQWEERESAACIEQIVQFRQILFGTRRDG